MKKLFFISVIILAGIYACAQKTGQNIQIIKPSPTLYLNGSNALIRLNDIYLTYSSGKLTLTGGNLNLGTTTLQGSGALGNTNGRFSKLWINDAEFTHAPTVNGVSIFYSPPITGVLSVPSSPVNPSDAASKAYVDSKITTGSTWVDPVEDIVSSLASGKVISLRYIKSTDNHLYVSNGDNTYTDLGATIAGTTAYVKADLAVPSNDVGPYNFNGSAWVSTGGGATSGSHNDLHGLQGGTSGEYYHLTAAEHTTVQGIPAAGSAGNIITSNGSALVSSAVPVWNQSTTGTAAKATILETARSIYGNSFDGSASLTTVISSGYGGTGNGFFKISGPASAEKTFTLPNASSNILTDNAAVTVAQGGTGRATATTAYGLIAAGTTATGAHQTLAAGTSGQILRSGGASALPAWSTATYPATAGTTGNLLISDGTNITSASVPTWNQSTTERQQKLLFWKLPEQFTVIILMEVHHLAV